MTFFGRTIFYYNLYEDELYMWGDSTHKLIEVDFEQFHWVERFVFLSAVDDRAWEERVAKANTVASVQVLTYGDRKVSAVCVHIARTL